MLLVDELIQIYSVAPYRIMFIKVLELHEVIIAVSGIYDVVDSRHKVLVQSFIDLTCTQLGVLREVQGLNV